MGSFFNFEHLLVELVILTSLYDATEFCCRKHSWVRARKCVYIEGGYFRQDLVLQKLNVGGIKILRIESWGEDRDVVSCRKSRYGLSLINHSRFWWNTYWRKRNHIRRKEEKGRYQGERAQGAHIGKAQQSRPGVGMFGSCSYRFYDLYTIVLSVCV